MPVNRIFNIECPADLEETVLCLDISEFENLGKEPGNDSDNLEDDAKFLGETHFYCIRQRIAKDLYKNGRNFAEIYKSVRQHILECEYCCARYVQFLGDYIKRQIKKRMQDKDNPSLLEELNSLPVDVREAYYRNSLKEADEKYLRILDVKSVRKPKKMDDEVAESFKKSSNPSLQLEGLRKNGLDYDGLFGVN